MPPCVPRNVTELPREVATAWAEYEISIPEGEAYNNYSLEGGGALGFIIVALPENHPGSTRIWVRDITWHE